MAKRPAYFHVEEGELKHVDGKSVNLALYQMEEWELKDGTSYRGATLFDGALLQVKATAIFEKAGIELDAPLYYDKIPTGR